MVFPDLARLPTLHDRADPPQAAAAAYRIAQFGTVMFSHSSARPLVDHPRDNCR